MALLGFWGIGNGQVPEVCTVSDTPIIFDDQDDGLPVYAPWGMYPPTNDTIWYDIPDQSAIDQPVIVGWWGRYTATNSVRGIPFGLQQAGENNWIQVQMYGDVDRIVISSAASRTGSVVTDFGDLTAPDGLDLNDWNFYELEVRFDDTEGSVRLRINGLTPTGWTDAAGVDTAPSGDSANLGVNFWQSNGATWFGIASGVYGADTSGSENNDFLGVCAFPYLTVDGDVESDWDGSDGNSTANFLLIDESPVARAEMTEYVESSTIAERQVCDADSFTALGFFTGGVVAVRTVAWTTDPLAGSQQMAIGMRSSAVDSSETVTLAAGDEVRSHLRVTDPATGATWVDAAVDSAQPLLEVV